MITSTDELIQEETQLFVVALFMGHGVVSMALAACTFGCSSLDGAAAAAEATPSSELQHHFSQRLSVVPSTPWIHRRRHPT